jgi:hypothetical protein
MVVLHEYGHSKMPTLSKVTFSLDQATLDRLQDAAERLSRPKSQVIREAILDFYERLGRLSERERVGMLRAFDDLVPLIPVRREEDVEHELSELRIARQHGGRGASIRETG